MGLQEERQHLVFTNLQKNYHPLAFLPSSGISMVKTGVEGPKATVSAATLHEYW